MVFSRLFRSLGANAEIERVIQKVRENRNYAAAVDKAISLRSLKRFREAIYLLSSVCEEYSPAFLVLGNTYAKMGNLDKAEQTYLNALQVYAKEGQPFGNAGAIECYLALGDLYLDHRKNFEKAEQYYQKAWEVPEPNVQGTKYHLVSTQGDILASVRPKASLSLARIYLQLKDFSKAKYFAKETLSKSPNNEEARILYGTSSLYEYIARVDDYKYITNDESPEKLLRAAKLLEPAAVSPDSPVANKVVYAAVLYNMTMTRYYAMRPELLNKILRKLEDTIAPILVQASKTGAESRRLSAAAFGAELSEGLDRLCKSLITKETTSRTVEGNFLLRSDMNCVLLPNYGVQYKKEKDQPGDFSVTPGNDQYVIPFITFLETVGPHLVFFFRMRDWASVEKAFQFWLRMM